MELKNRRAIAAAFVSAVSLLAVGATGLQITSRAVEPDGELKSAIVARVCADLEKTYVYAEDAVSMARLLRANLSSGEYGGLSSLKDLAERLTLDLRSVRPDQHLEISVLDTVKDPTGLIIHKATVLAGSLSTGDRVKLSVDVEKRGATALNHTATHILHACLREVLGDHVKQAGSLVAPDRFRFDFTHFSQVSAEELDEIERRANRRIRRNVPVGIEEMDAEEAFSSGATALFEEKYGDRVRVI